MVVTSLEDKLKEALEQLAEKRYTTRETALGNLASLLSLNFSPEFAQTNRETLCGACLRGLSRGEAKEQQLASKLLSVLVATYGRGQDNLYAAMSPTLREMVRFHADPEVRRLVTSTLALLGFVSTTGHSTALELLILYGELLEKVDEAPAGDEEEDTAKASSSASFKKALLDGFGLLSTKMPLDDIQDNVFPNYVGKVVSFLRDPSLDVRQAAGELLCLLLELQREVDRRDAPPSTEDGESNDVTPIEDYEGYFEVSELLDTLSALKTSNTRFTSKKDRSKQRNVFTDIEAGVLEGFAPKEKLVFQHQQVVFRSWAEYRMLEAFREALATGLQTHFVYNEAVQSIFDVKIDPEQARVSLSRLEKRLYMSPHSAEAKSRSKDRRLQGSVRSAALHVDNDDY